MGRTRTDAARCDGVHASLAVCYGGDRRSRGAVWGCVCVARRQLQAVVTRRLEVVVFVDIFVDLQLIALAFVRALRRFL